MVLSVHSELLSIPTVQQSVWLRRNFILVAVDPSMFIDDAAAVAECPYRDI